MIGRICWADLGRFRVDGAQCNIQGLPLYQLSLSPQGRFYPLRLRRGLGLFQEKKVRDILFPVDFHHWDILAQKGLRPYDPLPSLQGLGDSLVLRQLRRMGIPPTQAKVALVGERVTSTFQAVALSLCPLVQQLCIIAPQGGERLQGRLYQQYGMAPGFPWESCSLLLGFEKIPDENTPPILDIHQVNSSGFCGVSMKNRPVPPDISPLSWMGLLLQTGRLKPGEIEFT